MARYSELAPVREPAKTRPSGQLVAIAALALVALGESFALANSFGLDWGQMLILDRVSAADVHHNRFEHARSSQKELELRPASGTNCRDLADLGADPMRGRCKPRSWTR